jgi:very-short-patch-repair endonuclease
MVTEGLILLKIHNKKLVNNAKFLRKNMTKEERKLWYDFLRSYSIRFLRQKIIGNYIVDFYCPKANLVIELDGSEHYTDKGIVYDEERTEYLKNFGLQVIRIPNNYLKENFQGVCEYIDSLVKQSLRR